MLPFREPPSGISYGCSQIILVIDDVAPPSSVSGRVEMSLSPLRVSTQVF